MKPSKGGKRPPPDVSIDEALNLFFALTYPKGPPEGIDREALLETLRAKIAADRPEWAATQEERSQRNGASPAPEAEPGAESYSQLKAKLGEQARREEIPEDSEERFFYHRHQEARENRERQRAEAREEQVREDLRKRLIADRNRPGGISLERVLEIRKALESRLGQALAMSGDAHHGRAEGLEVDALSRPATEPFAPLRVEAGETQRTRRADPAEFRAGIDEAGRGVEMGPSVAVARLPEKSESFALSGASPGMTFPETPAEFHESLRSFDKELQIQSFREFNRARQERLEHRAELLADRLPARPERRAEPLALEEARDSEPMSLSMDGGAARRSPGMALNAGSKPAKRGLRLT